jgi:GntR family transcriptional repressor for pyruvate dehydrogenase complex
MSQPEKVLNHLEQIPFEKPSDIIIRQVRQLIRSGVLKPGDRLPAERDLVNRFRVGRSHIREALKKLEFYGIVETRPQNGTFVASLGVRSLEGLISNVLNLEKEDFHALLETRMMLETHGAELAATRATDEQIKEIETLQNSFREKVSSNQDGLDEDLAIHLKIAECSNNSVLQSLITLITPDIIRQSRKWNTCRDGRQIEALDEHNAIVEAIRLHDAKAAGKAMNAHLERTIEISDLVSQSS